MIKIFYGNDREAARQAMFKFFGLKNSTTTKNPTATKNPNTTENTTKNYEVIDATELTPTDLPSLFHGNSLFAESRRILIRDFFANKEIADLLPDYTDTPHQIVMMEPTFNQRTKLAKTLQQKQVELREFTLPDPDKWISFDIYRTAKQDGQKAIALLARVQDTTEPRQFLGSLASQAMKDYAKHPGTREKRVLRELSQLDRDLRNTSTYFEPWPLLQAFLLRLSSL